MNDPITYPDPPTRLVEPAASDPTAVPTRAVCTECADAGNEALQQAGRRGKKAATPAPAATPMEQGLIGDETLSDQPADS